MKRAIIAFTLMFTVFSVIQINAQDYYGAKISSDGSINADELVLKMSNLNKMEAKVEGTVSEVCQKKGCWMTMELPDGKTMRVSFKDYAFFVPKDIAGKTIIIKGNAVMETTSVADLRHYAEDGGASKKEIEKINNPKEELTFEAEGVIVK